MAPALRYLILPNLYRDSVELMRVAAELERQPGVVRAGVMMATPANLAVLRAAGLLDRAPAEARPNDVIAAVAAEDAAAAATALQRARDSLTVPPGDRGAAGGPTAPPVDRRRTDGPTTPAGERPAPHGAQPGAGAENLPRANLALISTPGPYATAEALKALKRGLNVFLFSGNVPLGDEIELKRLAERKGLLVMGPDCGTAILDGIPLGFANAVRRGCIGLVGASGTGLQQVCCLIDRLGEGVSQAIGVGGRDLQEEVGGVMALSALRRLAADSVTAVIVLISKPPAPAVARRVVAAAGGCGKPVVVNFLDDEVASGAAPGIVFASTFEEAARRAVALAGRTPDAPGVADTEAGDRARAARLPVPPGLGQEVICGLYCGGSLAGEAKLVLRRLLGEACAGRHTILDLGDDAYTAGQPHPMIDPRLRHRYLVDAARDPRVAVILLDVVLGYNAHPDPAGALAPVVEEAMREAARGGRRVAVVASVCGTPADPQNLRRQEASLAAAGVILAPSNAQAARLAAHLTGAVP